MDTFCLETYEDCPMESPTSSAKPVVAQPTTVDQESIAFGVMYCPRARVKRTEELNYDNRLLRQLEEELASQDDYIEAQPAQEVNLQMGFV